LWPYRMRLAMACLCVLAIMVLWGGGLGMLGPLTRVLIDDQGLHGWAYGKLVGDRLGARVTPAKVPPGTRIGSAPAVNPVLTVASLHKDGPTRRAGLSEGEWIVGVDDGREDHALLRGDELVRLLAEVPGGRRIALRIYNPYTAELRVVAVSLDTEKATSRMLGRVVSLIPEPRTSAEKFNVLLILLGAALVSTYLRDLFRFTQEYLVETAVARGIIDLRCETYNVALRLPVTFFNQQGTTDTMSRFVKDTGMLGRAQVTLFGKTLAEPAKAAGAIAMAAIYSWELTLLAMVAGPPTYLLIRKFGKRMRRVSKKALEGWSAMLGVLEETLTGIRVVKAYTMEGTERRRFFRANRRLFRQQKKMAKIDAAVSPTVEALGITAAAGAAALAGYWVLHQKMDTETFLVVMGCLAAMFDPVRKLSKVVTRFQRADAAAARVFEVQDRQQEKSPPGAPMLPRHARSIELRNVGFRYPGAAEDALKDVNLTIEAGQTIAIVGPNGCGKTTLVSLIPRLMDPTAGQVLIDGHDISKYSIRSVRRQIALVTQETVLFHATIAENISYGLRRPREADVLAAARKAFVDEFALELPEGYQTMVSERGATLSGGQRQRISIARAILRDPAIMIFDEATSQIDADSERRIHQAMDEFIKDRTAIMIAHRFATVLHADRIVVMNAGRIVDTGTHEALLDSCDLYRHLYNTQLSDAGGGGPTR